MIDAKELRIGNYVTSKQWGGVAKIQGIEETSEGYDIKVNGYVHHYIVGQYFDLIPIPLTKEILLKCGFKKSRNIGCYDTDHDAFFFESDKISLTIDFILSSSNHYYESTPVDGAIPLKYLHQLQNLVFLVTGEELEINL